MLFYALVNNNISHVSRDFWKRIGPLNYHLINLLFIYLYIYIYIYRLDEKWSKKQTTHRSMFNTDVSPFGLLQCIQTGITAILVMIHLFLLTKYCCNTCLYTLKKPEGRNVCIKHGPVSSLLFTPFFIQPIYYLVESRHPVSLLGSYSQVAFFVGDAAFFIQPIYIYIYIFFFFFFLLCYVMIHLFLLKRKELCAKRVSIILCYQLS